MQGIACLFGFLIIKKYFRDSKNLVPVRVIGKNKSDSILNLFLLFLTFVFYCIELRMSPIA